MSQRRFRIKSKTSIIVFVVYLLISGLFLGFSAGGFIVNFKELGFSIISGVEKGIHSVTNGVSTFFTAIGDLADLRVEYEKLQERSIPRHILCTVCPLYDGHRMQEMVSRSPRSQ